MSQDTYFPISTAANSVVSQSEATKNFNEISRCDSIFALKPRSFLTRESVWLKLPKNSKKIKKRKFPVFKEDSIFVTRRRSHKKMLRMRNELEVDFDNDSTEEMLEDSIAFQMRLTLKNLMRIKEERRAGRGKRRYRKKYFQKMIKKFKADVSDASSSED